MLTTRLLNEGISSILVSLKNSDLEGAKKLIDALSPNLRTERERGALLAAAGIYTSMARAKGGTMQSWDQGRVVRAATSIVSSQMADDIDKGYAETLMSYSKLIEQAT